MQFESELLSSVHAGEEGVNDGYGLRKRRRCKILLHQALVERKVSTRSSKASFADRHSHCTIDIKHASHAESTIISGYLVSEVEPCAWLLGTSEYFQLALKQSLRTTQTAMTSPIRYVMLLCWSLIRLCYDVALFMWVQWAYSEFVGIQASPKATNEFIISLKKKGIYLSVWIERAVFSVTCNSGGKTQQMTFSCDYRAEVLTEALVSRLVGRYIICTLVTLPPPTHRGSAPFLLTHQNNRIR